MYKNSKNVIFKQVAGENEAGQTLLVAAEGVEGAVEGVEGSVEGEGEGVMYVTREDGQVNLFLFIRLTDGKQAYSPHDGKRLQNSVIK